MALGWVLAAILMFITVIGIPFAFAALNMARYALLPFGQTTIDAGGLGNSPIGTLVNLVWFFLAGWWLALLHLAHAVVLAITIIGLPFAWAHLKLAGLAIWPLGREVVSSEVLLWRR
jgi:uncharacterized membrane protein YccF (DUF307 family)